MATTSSKGTSTGSKGGSVSLAEEDRRYLTESLGAAKDSGAGQVDENSVFEALERFGLSSERVRRLRKSIANLDVRESVDRASEYLAQQIENARDYAKVNPKKVIGGAAGVLVGASLLALAIRRAAGEDKKKVVAQKKASSVASSSKKAAPSSSPKKASAASKKRRR